MCEDPDLRQKILDGNLEVHAKEAKFYDRIHPELFNALEQFRLRRDLRWIAAHNVGREALDVGCGTGNVALKLLDLGYRVTAVDLSQEMLEMLRAKVQGHANLERLSVFHSELAAFLTRPGSQYDLATVSSVLHHLPDYLGSLKRLCECIRPGGMLYITHEPAGRPFEKMSRYERLLLRIDQKVYFWLFSRVHQQVPKRDWRYSDYHVFQGFDETGVVNALKSWGVEIVRFRYYGCSACFALSGIISNLVLRSRTHFQLIGRKQWS